LDNQQCQCAVTVIHTDTAAMSQSPWITNDADAPSLLLRKQEVIDDVYAPSLLC
jgi:hypothetical protein